MARLEQQASAQQPDAAFAKAAGKQLFKIGAFALLAVVGLAAAAAGVITATSVVAAVAGTTGFAIPLAVAGAAVLGAGARFTVNAVKDYNTIKAAAKGTAGKTDEVISSRMAPPEETGKLSRTAACLKGSFSPASSEQAAAPSAAAPAEPGPAAPKP